MSTSPTTTGAMASGSDAARACRVFFDTEFLENGHTIQLISIGMVREDGATFYAETLAAERLAESDPWLRENVRPHLRGGSCVMGSQALADAVRDFAGPNPEFWAYYADYDWVVLCHLFGRMIDLPSGWPMFCRDVKQEADRLGVKLPKQETAEHDALADAHWAESSWRLLRAAALAAPAPVVPEGLRALSEAATQGEWSIWAEPIADADEAVRELTSQVSQTSPMADHLFLLNAGGKCPATTGCGPTSEANATFVVALVNWFREIAATPSKPVGDGGEASAPPAGGGDDEPLTSTDAVRHWEAEQAMAAGEPVTSSDALALWKVDQAAADTSPAGGGAVGLEAAAEIVSAAYYDAMIGQVPHTHGWAGKPESFKKNVRARMAGALRAAGFAAAPAAPEPAAAEALRGISDDFMTSDRHHPGYVLIPAAKFEQLRAAEASLSAPSEAETAGGDGWIKGPPPSEPDFYGHLPDAADDGLGWAVSIDDDAVLWLLWWEATETGSRIAWHRKPLAGPEPTPANAGAEGGQP